MAFDSINPKANAWLCRVCATHNALQEKTA